MNQQPNHNQRPPFPQQPGPFVPQQAAAPVKPKRRRWVTVAVGVGALFVGFNIGNAGSDETAVADPAPTETVTAPAEPQATTTVTAEPKAEKPKPAKKKAKPKPTLTDGTWEIGVDIPAGTYKGTVPDDSINCYVETASDNSGTLDSIIANENYNPGARVTLTVKDGHFQTLDGCGELVKA